MSLNFSDLACDEVVNGGSQQTRDSCLRGVTQNGFNLKLVWEQTEEICIAAVSQDGMAIYYVKELTLEICKTALAQNCSAISYIDDKNILLYLGVEPPAPIIPRHFSVKNFSLPDTMFEPRPESIYSSPVSTSGGSVTSIYKSFASESGSLIKRKNVSLLISPGGGGFSENISPRLAMRRSKKTNVVPLPCI